MFWISLTEKLYCRPITYARNPNPKPNKGEYFAKNPIFVKFPWFTASTQDQATEARVKTKGANTIVPTSFSTTKQKKWDLFFFDAITYHNITRNGHYEADPKQYDQEQDHYEIDRFKFRPSRDHLKLQKCCSSFQFFSQPQLPSWRSHHLQIQLQEQLQNGSRLAQSMRWRSVRSSAIRAIVDKCNKKFK